MTASQLFLGGRVELRPGDCRDVLRAMPDACIDSVVTDPPYALVSIVKRFGGAGAAAVKGNDAYSRAASGFMGKQWDTGEVAFATEFWAEVLRVLKPGGHVVAFSGTRTYHRMAVAIEDAGFEIRDQLAWMYGTGFPKSHDVSKAIDKAAGVERARQPVQSRANPSVAIHASGFGSPDWSPQVDEPATMFAAQWDGWGTALKPAWEPICLGRKPLISTVANNVLQHGTGAINVDACRIGDEERVNPSAGHNDIYGQFEGAETAGRATVGRFPANILHDGSDEVVDAFPETAASTDAPRVNRVKTQFGFGDGKDEGRISHGHADAGGSAARFFYSAKADKLDRIGSKHPTVKPVDLMQWLVRLITPPGGVVLDPFAGSGSTGEAAWREGMRCVLVEREEEYQADIVERLRLADAGPATRLARAIKQVDTLGPLFGDNDNAPAAEVAA